MDQKHQLALVGSAPGVNAFLHASKLLRDHAWHDLRIAALGGGPDADSVPLQRDEPRWYRERVPAELTEVHQLYLSDLDDTARAVVAPDADSLLALDPFPADTVVVAAPAGQREATVRAALGRGLAVLVPPPLALDVDTALALLALADEHRAPILVVDPARGEPLAAMGAWAVETGLLGRVRLASWSEVGPRPGDDVRLAAGRPLADEAFAAGLPGPLRRTLARLDVMLGPPQTVSAVGDEGTWQVRCGWPDGAVAQLALVPDAAVPHHQPLTLCGTAGTLAHGRLTTAAGPRPLVDLFRSGADPATAARCQPRGLADALAVALRASLDRLSALGEADRARCEPGDGLREVELLAAVAESARLAGAPVSVSETVDCPQAG